MNIIKQNKALCSGWGKIVRFDVINLVFIWVSTLLYGLNIVFFAVSLYILASKSSNGGKPYVLLLSSTFIFVLATIHIGMSLAQLLQAFTDESVTSAPDGSIIYWFDIILPVAQAKFYIQVFADSVQNWVLIWRFYVVWGRNWKMLVIPSIIELVHLILGIVDTSRTDRGHDSTPLDILQFSCCTAVNIICTLGIVVRLWNASRSSPLGGVWISSRKGEDYYLHTIFIVLESGALFTIFSMFTLVIYCIQTPTSDAIIEGAFDVNVQVALLAPLLILLRAHFGVSHGLWKSQGKAKHGPSSNRMDGRTVQLESFGRTSRDQANSVYCVRPTTSSITDVADEVKYNSGAVGSDHALYLGQGTHPPNVESGSAV
ncbi:uncharacterized protein LAESUDRAFT_811401 [Laetiporus sulphureus 93-53]|uniref:Family A G protein-coupled receptor-like protein n=1 Tax=Laetiporus sulphureus 93-53 TaxID=1314785 RepID=A0A165FE31_9APHY|nr:uncharacterized protein LAESUDRAFT_811401 [Laetiporus sulphureus 93-53]KZT08831.1 hypothetical protein LAESUDRAFT_811401 [Laetiporus sulphureus 93-53]